MSASGLAAVTRLSRELEIPAIVLTVRARRGSIPAWCHTQSGIVAHTCGVGTTIIESALKPGAGLPNFRTRCLQLAVA